MPHIAIIADDLTGALDAAAPFAARGRRVVVATVPAAFDAAVQSGAEVVAVSTRSREIPAAEARARMAGVVACVPPGVTILKKIDSRMKGNIASELDAMGTGPLLVCPAIPELGRFVCDGAVTGAGVETPIPVAAALGGHAARATVPDTARQTDLDRALEAHVPASLVVGASGMAEAMAAQRYGARVGGWSGALPFPATLVIGSTDRVTLAQLAALRARRPDLVVIAAPNGVVPPGAPEADFFVIQATPGAVQARAQAVAKRLAMGAMSHLRASRTILVTGGATAEALFDALGIERLDVAGEVLPGLPVCRQGDTLFITKSGGFGGPDDFCRLFATTAEAEDR